MVRIILLSCLSFGLIRKSMELSHGRSIYIHKLALHLNFPSSFLSYVRCLNSLWRRKRYKELRSTPSFLPLISGYLFPSPLWQNKNYIYFCPLPKDLRKTIKICFLFSGLYVNILYATAIMASSLVTSSRAKPWLTPWVGSLDQLSGFWSWLGLVSGWT